MVTGEFATLEPFLNSSFSIAVCIYLLYERSKFNEKVVACMENIAVTMKDIKDGLNR